MRLFLALFIAILALIPWAEIWFTYYSMVIGMVPWSQRRLDNLKLRAVFATLTAAGLLWVLTCS